MLLDTRCFLHTCLYSPIMEPFFLISDSDLSSSRLHISFSCGNTHTHTQITVRAVTGQRPRTDAQSEAPETV